MGIEDSGRSGRREYSAPMSFDVAAEAYDQFMGRYSVLLAPQLADLAEMELGQRAIDVGCGPGALTAELVRRLGADHVAAVDPSEPFVAATRSRYPGVDVRHASAEALPFDDDAFDAALAQLAVHFMTDPVGGIAQMARVTRPGGLVVACVWDHAGGKGPLGLFWDVARELSADTVDESNLPGVRNGHLAELFVAAGIRDVRQAIVHARLEHATFEEWWEPFTKGVGPAGAHVVGLDADARERLRERCRERLPEGPFTIDAIAWAARGVV
jgi:ubiquinone/menaquinone biosynthesis C-methylase UbiE